MFVKILTPNLLCFCFTQALYENMLIELPFASFFLSKMLGQHNINVDIDHLQSLDPVLYKNLLSLKVSVR